MTNAAGWPEIPVASWAETRDTVHLWTQIVGKVRLALAPPANQWWQVPFYVNSRGLTTSLMPYQSIGVEITFDFADHVLLIRTTDGRSRRLVLERRSVADFYREFRSSLRELELDVPMLARPVEIADAIPFEQDEVHASYDASAMHDFWLSLVAAHRVLSRFRGEFEGKASPVHFFWEASTSRSAASGRPAPPHPGGVPNCPDWVMTQAYSQEVSSAGYWPGGSAEGSFYSYAYPEPPGFRDDVVLPAGAGYRPELGEFILPYAQVRTADDPDALLLQFLRSTYDAAAGKGGWEISRPRAQ